MNELIKTTQNENGDVLVHARELHKALEVKTRFSQWVTQNFKHFVENRDFTGVVTTTVVNNGGRIELDDYVMVLDMAKHIAMMSGTDKGFEIREYFIQVEKQHKQQLDTSNLSPELQFMNSVVQSLAKQELATKQLESKVDHISEIVTLNSTDWRKDARELINQMAHTQGGYGAYQEIQRDIYHELERRAGCDLERRLTNMKNRMAGEGIRKSKIDRVNKLDVIEREKRLLEIYLAIVKEFSIRYGVREQNKQSGA